MKNKIEEQIFLIKSKRRLNPDEILGCLEDTLGKDVVFEIELKSKENNLEDYTVELDYLAEKFEEDIKEFARGGDERDNIPSNVEELEDLKQRILKDELLAKKDKKELISKIEKEIKHEKKVYELAEYHQRSMARHEGGSAYHKTYAELLEEIGL